MVFAADVWTIQQRHLQSWNYLLSEIGLAFKIARLQKFIFILGLGDIHGK
jgi:hypothetical protein